MDHILPTISPQKRPQPKLEGGALAALSLALAEPFSHEQWHLSFQPKRLYLLAEENSFSPLVLNRRKSASQKSF
jgi:hypothetical protein